MSKRRAFTLIEMLIVIVIIGILAAALVPRLQSVQGRARDTKRKADISQINNAILIYNTDTGKYPQSANVAGGVCPLNANCYRFSSETPLWIANISGYMSTIPQGPINNGINARNTTGVFSYAYVCLREHPESAKNIHITSYAGKQERPGQMGNYGHQAIQWEYNYL